MATIHEIFNRLVEEKHISVEVDSFKSHDALRIRLVKLFSRHKAVLADIGADDGSGVLSVSAHFDADRKVSTFHIRRRQGIGQQDFKIVETDTAAHG